MSILDTDVLAALMRTVPEAPVVAWLDRPPAESVWITGITLFEARLGLLPSGLLKEDLENRVLDFDSVAAAEAALLAAARQKSGGQWTCVTRKSRASRWRGAPPLSPETYGILRI
jgi:toxin FitB